MDGQPGSFPCQDQLCTQVLDLDPAALDESAYGASSPSSFFCTNADTSEKRKGLINVVAFILLISCYVQA